ncbi:M24 family metallopeptidase [Natribacillus halophilus]|uniref:Xaa-Pro dipeptidase n=1 Tax=Natribacillus halophilus TaxID=549003 RepID=A0A1G8R8W2_9BACI|nr:Xaa-Pro peptidase family protein [Natribacillus halophilus]SDJ12965.1 Xaa-Pro dipeptidase [Natribacillus halophilus]
MDNQYEKRINRIKEHLHQTNMNVALITSPKNVYYLTGFFTEPFERFMALVIDNRHNEVYLFVPALDKDAAKNAAIVGNVIPIEDSEDHVQILADFLNPNLLSIGIEKDHISLQQYEDLSVTLNDTSFYDIGAYIMSLRVIKSQDEIHKIKGAIKAIEKVMEKGEEKIRFGMSELDLVSELEYHMRKNGAEGPSFPTIALFGENSALPHGKPGSRYIRKGDFVLIDMGVIVDGYCSDITRTFLFGEGTAEKHTIYNIVKEANEKAIEAVKIGEPLGVIDEAARSYIIEKGYGDYFNNRIGHGLGIDVHEKPSLHNQNDNKIEPGMVFTIEPGIYLPEFGGVRIEDNVYVKESGGVEVLTTYPTDLKIL